jgi:hypothetical protein
MNKDLCPACYENLYFDDDITQRVGILSEDYFTVEGWMCPHCKSRFDLDNNLLYISDQNNKVGKA